MRSTTLTVPAEIVPTIQHGAINELGFAAEAILALCEPLGDAPDSAYETAFAHLAAARELLSEVGYTTPKPSASVEIDVVKHLWILLQVMGGQRRADIECSDEMAPAERSAANRRVQALEEPVRIVPYDPDWPARFEQERAALADAIGDWAVGGIHHVGSTSVPGLVAKPVIDILVGVRDLEDSRGCFERLAGLGYLYAPYRSGEMHWFCKPDPSRRTHHLHLVPNDSPRFRDELAFRDHLREHPDVAREYGALKRGLAKRFEHDREAYTEAKSEFILTIVHRALDQSSRG